MWNLVTRVTYCKWNSSDFCQKYLFVTLLFFYATDCAPCMALKRALESWQPPKGISLQWVNSREKLDVAIEKHVWQVPTLILEDAQREQWRYSGFISPDRLSSMLKDFLKNFS
jgi:thiol-disulfide isomerase/thioredoxin